MKVPHTHAGFSGHCDMCDDKAGPFFLRSRCHPSRPFWLEITHDDQGQFVVARCSKCDAVVAIVPVKERDS